VQSHKSFHGLMRRVWFPVCVIAIMVPGVAKGQEEPAEDLEKAIAALRNVKPGELSETEQKLKCKEMDGAWEVIKAAGPKGITRLKEEIAKIDRDKADDDFFKLDVAQLLWMTAKVDEAEAIAAIWRSADLNAQYDYVFDIGRRAAMTQDPRVLPMLKAILRDNKGNTYVVQHSMPVKWPGTVMFIWGPFGPKGLPALLDVLKTSEDPVEQQNAIILLGDSQCLEALPLVRRLAKTGDGPVRSYAIRCLGVFGHPEDFQLLVSGLESKDPTQLSACIWGLVAYEDLRAVPPLIKLLDSEDDKVRTLAIDALQCLVTVDGLDALHKNSLDAKSPGDAKGCRKAVKDLMSAMKLDWDTYAAKPAPERAELLAKVDKREETFCLKEGDRKLTHKEFLKAAKEWKKQRSISGGKYKWVEDRHVMAATTPKDIDLLLEVRAAVYTRLSDECLYEVDTINKIVQRLARSRYREVVGVCPKVEPRRDKAEPTEEGGSDSEKTPSSKAGQQDN
jgi:hypothetical protein